MTYYQNKTMPDTFTTKATVSKSILKTPSSKTNLQSLDSYNAMGHALQQIDEQRRIRFMRFPLLKGRHNVDAYQEKTTEINGSTGINDGKELQPVAPHRLYDSLIDPTSMFISAGCDVDNVVDTQIESMNMNNTSQSVTPNSTNKRQKIFKAPHELTRLGTWCPGAPTAWNSRKTLDVWIRAKLGGWTSDVDPRKSKDRKRQPQTSPMTEHTQLIQDKQALKYIYGASTQRGYEDVPWDYILRPKRWPPTSTGEDRADIALYHRNAKRYNLTVQDLQALDHDSDHFLSKYIRQEPVTRSKLGMQILQSPLYSVAPKYGCKSDEEVERFEPCNQRISSANHSREKLSHLYLTSPTLITEENPECLRWSL